MCCVSVFGFNKLGGCFVCGLKLSVVIRLLVVRLVMFRCVFKVVLVMCGVSVMCLVFSNVGCIFGLFLYIFRLVVKMCLFVSVCVNVVLFMMLLCVRLISVVVGFICVSLVVLIVWWFFLEYGSISMR